MKSTTEFRRGNKVLIPSHSDMSVPLIPCIEKTIRGITRFGEFDFTEPEYPEDHIVNPKHCAGIPLTKNWLVLLFGLEKHPEFMNVLEDYSINYTDSLGQKCQMKRQNYKGQSVHISFVHQLQNLYFALTGEELTIK